MNKDVVSFYNGMLLSHKRMNELLPLKNMDELGGYYAKRNVRDQEVLYDITYV